MPNTPTIHVGSPPIGFNQVPERGHSVVCFHDFENLDKTLGSFVESPSFNCISGHKWKLRLYPGGTAVGPPFRPPYISLELVNCSNPIVARVQIYVRQNVHAPSKNQRYEFGCGMTETGHLFESGQTYVWNDMIGIDEIKLGKALVVEVTVVSVSSLYVQRGMESMRPFFGDQATSDVAFQTRDAILYAHKLVLKAQAPDLYDLCESFDKEKAMPVDVDSRILQAMLGTLYGNVMMADDWTDDLKSILLVADKYGFPGLKAEADKWYTKATELTVDNAVDELLCADGNGRAVMKAAAIKFIVENAENILPSDSFMELHKSHNLVREIMSAMRQKY